MDASIAAIFGAFSGAGLFFSLRAANRDKNSLDEMKKAEVYSPQRLAASFQDPNFLVNAPKSTENPDEHVIKAFIEGTVLCDRPIKSLINDNIELVHRVYNRESRYSNDLIGAERKVDPKSLKYGTLGTQIRAPLLFKIGDDNATNTCEVHRSLLVDASDAITSVGERQQNKKLDWFDKTLVFLGVVAEAFRASFSKNSNTRIRGILIGFTEREFGIRVKSPLTVFGDVIYNSKDNSLRVESPLYYLHEKINGVRILEGKLIGNYFIAGLCGIVFAVCGYYIGKKVIQHLKRREEIKVEKETDKLKNTKKLTLENGYKCVCCREQTKNIILKPCLHFSLCKDCFDKLKEKKCPVCKKTVSEAVDIFFS